MSLGQGQTTENDGLGDSKHAYALPQEWDEVDLVGSRSTDSGSMPTLPSTIAETVCRSQASTKASQVVCGLIVLDEEMGEDAQVVLGVDLVSEVDAADLPMAMGGGHNSEGRGLGDSRHATPDTDADSSDYRLLIDRHGSYGRLEEVGHDVQYLGSVIVEMWLVIRRLERKINALEDEADKAKGDALGVRSSVILPAVLEVPCGPRLDKGYRPAIPPNLPGTLPSKPRTLVPIVVVCLCEISAPAPAPLVAGHSTWSKVGATGLGSNCLPW